MNIICQEIFSIVSICISIQVTLLQVTEPLRAMVVGSALEDARNLAQRYDRVRQDAEAQVTNYVMQYDELQSTKVHFRFYKINLQ